MKLLLDTNVLIDYYARRKPFFNDAIKLRIAAMFGDVELWAASQSFPDIEYLLKKSMSIKEIRAFMRESTEFLKISSSTSADMLDAMDSDWPDMEDYLIARCAERIKADRIITRDLKGFKDSDIIVQTPADFFAWLYEEHDVEYDEIDF